MSIFRLLPQNKAIWAISLPTKSHTIEVPYKKTTLDELSNKRKHNSPLQVKFEMANLSLLQLSKPQPIAKNNTSAI